jgi:hypothetical protein
MARHIMRGPVIPSSGRSPHYVTIRIGLFTLACPTWARNRTARFRRSADPGGTPPRLCAYLPRSARLHSRTVLRRGRARLVDIGHELSSDPAADMAANAAARTGWGVRSVRRCTVRPDDNTPWCSDSIEPNARRMVLTCRVRNAACYYYPFSGGTAYWITDEPDQTS